MGLDRPIVLQYADWLWNLVRGDWGTSFRDGRPVPSIIGGHLFATLLLMGGSTVISIALGTWIGIRGAVKRNSAFDYVTTVGAMIALSIPTFWFGLTGRRGRDIAHTKQVMTDRLKWLHPRIREDIRREYFWFGELDMQRKTIPRLYGLAPGAVALTGLAGRGVPTGSMLGGILSEWALDVPEAELSLPVEPLKVAPFYMSFAPRLSLRQFRAKDWIAVADLPRAAHRIHRQPRRGDPGQQAAARDRLRRGAPQKLTASPSP